MGGGGGGVDLLTPPLSTMERLQPRLNVQSMVSSMSNKRHLYSASTWPDLALKALVHAATGFVELSSVDSQVLESATQLEYLRHIVELGPWTKTYPQPERGLSILLRHTPPPTHTRAKGPGP